jgi:3-dehydroquinate dehydratase
VKNCARDRWVSRHRAGSGVGVSQGILARFGVAGYALALRGLKDLLAAKK